MDVVSFFAGCGGLDLGFERAGFRVIWANEFEPHCRSTYIRNHPSTEFILGDIRNINFDTIPNCDGFIGGPPCQSWSVGGKQNGLEDERGQLFLHYIKIINIKKPKFFVIENVKGILDNKFKDAFSHFINELENAGYYVKWALLDAAQYCVPQNRERVFFVGFRKELNIHFVFPAPLCTEPVTIEKAIGDIVDIPNSFLGNNVIKSASTEDKIPNHDVLNSAFGSFYYRGNRRRGWQYPSFTINATADFAPLHPSSPKMIYYGHENWNFQKDKINEYRRLSVRECARIQTFPDEFIFEYTNIRDAYKMIGNAVPPLLGQVIAQAISISLTNKEVRDDIGITTTKKNLKAYVLVGYFKNNIHLKLILKHQLYYVRSDGRYGSIFKDDCTRIPDYLLLHHKNLYEFYELEPDEPDLVDSSFLKSLGYDVNGNTYLCFKLKSSKPKSIKDLGGNVDFPKYNQRNYIPYFTTIDQLIN